MPNNGWRKQSKCIFDSERRFEFRRIRDIRVRDIESRLYLPLILREQFILVVSELPERGQNVFVNDCGRLPESVYHHLKDRVDSCPHNKMLQYWF